MVKFKKANVGNMVTLRMPVLIIVSATPGYFLEDRQELAVAQTACRSSKNTLARPPCRGKLAETMIKARMPYARGINASGELGMYKTLVVEDNVVFRETLVRLLNDRFTRMQIESAGDGRLAMEKYSAFYPNLVLMDIRLPGESGLELTRKIRLTNQDVKIVILTSHDAPEYRQAATKSGANFFVSKSNTSSEEIIRLVESILPRESALPVRA
ncbi:MAG: response regulator transcription factor [Pseudomonadota bacterium]